MDAVRRSLGRYGRGGISLALAREKCLDAKRAIGEGRSPAIEKQREKRRLKEAKSFGEFGEKWLAGAPMTVGISQVSGIHEPMILNWIDVVRATVRCRRRRHHINGFTAVQGQRQHYLARHGRWSVLAREQLPSQLGASPGKLSQKNKRFRRPSVSERLIKPAKDFELYGEFPSRKVNGPATSYGRSDRLANRNRAFRTASDLPSGAGCSYSRAAFPEQMDFRLPANNETPPK